MMVVSKGLVIAAALLLWNTQLLALELPLCLYVGSYHAGYHWNDGVERGLEKGLGQSCRLERFYLDSLRDKSPTAIAARAKEAADWIAREQPALVIACDDPASAHLVMPYLKDAKTPVVFCGINWTVEPYGYPYTNTTGMIEVAPIEALLKEAMRLRLGARRLVFLTADVSTQHKEVEYLQAKTERFGLELDIRLVKDFASWRQGFLDSQGADLVILGNPAGIAGWDDAKAGSFIETHTRTLTLSFGVAMSTYAILSMINVPEEQGEWSAELAKAILKGTAPNTLPITSNRRSRMLVNSLLAKRMDLYLPEYMLQQAVRSFLPDATGP